MLGEDQGWWQLASLALWCQDKILTHSNLGEERVYLTSVFR